MTLALETMFTPLQDHPQPLDGIWFDRNWHLESTPVWSRSTNATLAVAAQSFPEPTPLVMWFRVFGATPAAPRRLTVSSAGHAAQTITVRTSRPVAVQTMTPVQRDGTHTSISLILDTISSPFTLGLSPDDRLLGVQVMSITAGQPTLDWPLDFTTPDQISQILESGWANIDAGNGVWSVGEQANLTLPGYLRRKGASTLVIEADVLGRPAGMPPLSVQAVCNEQNIVTWQLTSASSEPLQCPLPDWYDNTSYHITLQFTDLKSPAELGINSDTRPLGLYVRRIELECKDQAPGSGSCCPPQKPNMRA